MINIEKQPEISVEDHNQLTSMGFTKREFSDGSGFWYAITRKDLPFFNEVEFLYEPEKEILSLNIQILKEDEFIESEVLSVDNTGLPEEITFLDYIQYVLTECKFIKP